MTQDIIDRLRATHPIIEEVGDGLSMRQHSVSKGEDYMRISLRPYGRLGHVLWLHSDTMQCQLEMTSEQMGAFAEMVRRYDEEVVDYA